MAAAFSPAAAHGGKDVFVHISAVERAFSMHASGATIPDAMVTILSLDKRAMQAASTNDEGRYEFSNIAEGRYTLEVSAPGFAVTVSGMCQRTSASTADMTSKTA